MLSLLNPARVNANVPLGWNLIEVATTGFFSDSRVTLDLPSDLVVRAMKVLRSRKTRSNMFGHDAAVGGMGVFNREKIGPLH